MSKKLSDFDPLVAGLQARTLAVDFGEFLETGLTLTGTPDIAISVVSGTDATPSARVTEGPIVGTLATDQGGTGKANTAIKFQLSALAAEKYLLEYSCLVSNGDTVAAFNHIKSVVPK